MSDGTERRDILRRRHYWRCVGNYRTGVNFEIPDFPATPTHNDDNDDGLENRFQFSPRIWHVFSLFISSI